jgi:hypothetical protein
MDYNEALKQVRELFLYRLAKVVKDDAYLANPKLPKEVYLDALYTDIMALGYNFGDLDKAAEDSYEMKSALWGKNYELKSQNRMGVKETQRLYPKEINIFSNFHKLTQDGVGFKEAIATVKNLLDS